MEPQCKSITGGLITDNELRENVQCIKQNHIASLSIDAINRR